MLRFLRIRAKTRYGCVARCDGWRSGKNLSLRDVESSMAVTRLNHAVLWVRDAEVTASFYVDNLGFHVAKAVPGAIFLQTHPNSLNDHDLGVFSIGSEAGPPTERRNVGMYHLAWEVETLRELIDIRTRLFDVGSLVGESSHGVSRSLYAKDPDGLEFEVLWAVPVDLLDPTVDDVTTAPLDLAGDVERFGLDLPARVTA